MEVGKNGAGLHTGIDLISSLLKIPDIAMACNSKIDSKQKSLLLCQGKSASDPCDFLVIVSLLHRERIALWLAQGTASGDGMSALKWLTDLNIAGFPSLALAYSTGACCLGVKKNFLTYIPGGTQANHVIEKQRSQNFDVLIRLHN